MVFIEDSSGYMKVTRLQNQVTEKGELQMIIDEVSDIDGLRFWKAFRDRYYVKVPYARKSIMDGRKPVGEYYRNGKLKFVQYETTIDEAEKLMKKHKIMGGKQ